jgi:hypothetical protein
LTVAQLLLRSDFERAISRMTAVAPVENVLGISAHEWLARHGATAADA